MRMLGSLSSSQQQALMANYLGLTFNFVDTQVDELGGYTLEEIGYLFNNPNICNEDVACLVEEFLGKEGMCPHSISAETLLDQDVEAWYFKFLNLSYFFQYKGLDISGKPICNTYNIGFSDICAQVYRNPTNPGSSGLAAVKFSNAFNSALCATLSWLRESPWDDILMWSAGPAAEVTTDILVINLIKSHFRAELEIFLKTEFGGNPTLSSGPCQGVQGRVAVFSPTCFGD